MEMKDIWVWDHKINPFGNLPESFYSWPIKDQKRFLDRQEIPITQERYTNWWVDEVTYETSLNVKDIIDDSPELPEDTNIPHWVIYNSPNFKWIDRISFESYMKNWWINNKPYKYKKWWELKLQQSEIKTAKWWVIEYYKLLYKWWMIWFEFVRRETSITKVSASTYSPSYQPPSDELWYNNM